MPLWIPIWCGAAAIIGYAYIGYPLVALALAKFRGRSPRNESPVPSSVAFIIAVHNGEDQIAERLGNLARCTEASQHCQNARAIIVSDGSSDNTVAEARKADQLSESLQVTVLDLPFRLGKPNALNHAFAHLDSAEITILGDLRQRFTEDSIDHLLSSFCDPTTGAVSGRLQIGAANSSTGSGVGGYWAFETLLRNWEGACGAGVTCTGAIYAIRSELWQPIPLEATIDDMLIPLQISEQGYQVRFEKRALAIDPLPPDPTTERIRKRRTLAGNLQLLAAHPHWCFPGFHPLWWRLVSHKYLRLAVPWCLILMLAASAYGAIGLGCPLGWLLLVPLIAVLTLGMIGRRFPNTKHPLFSIPAAFLFLNQVAIEAVFEHMSPKRSTHWATAGDAGRRA